MEWVETTGETLEEAKNIALDQLGVAEDEAEFEIIEEPRPDCSGAPEARPAFGPAYGPPPRGARPSVATATAAVSVVTATARATVTVATATAVVSAVTASRATNPASATSPRVRPARRWMWTPLPWVQPHQSSSAAS